MLTKNDLDQIRGIVREEVKEEVSTQLKPVNQRLDQADHRLNRVYRRLARLQKEMTLIVHDYTNAIVHVRKKGEKIEDHLNLS